MSLENGIAEPPQGPVPKWIGGGLAPLAVVVYALVRFATGTVSIGRHGERQLHGTEAAVFCLGLLGLAIFLHTHFFWGNTERLGAYSGMGKAVGAFILIGSLIYVAVQVYRPL